MVVDWEKRFVFIHVPKTGGTSIQAALGREKPGKFLRKLYSLGVPAPPAIAAVSWATKHETYEEWLARFQTRTGRDEKAARELLPIMFCRHPVSRFLSLHRFLLKSKSREFPDIPEDINRFATVALDPNSPYESNIRSLRPQVDFLPRHGKVEIGKFETLELDFAKIFSKFGINRSLPRLNTSRPKSAAQDQELSATSLRALCDFYAEDFRAFGYQVDDECLCLETPP
jgi:hypothetical protein